jgi:hypothetical protein
MVSVYLKSELCIHGRIQLPLVELKALKIGLKIKINTRQEYLDPETKLEVVELHLDSHPSFCDTMNATTGFGGNLSFQMLPNNRPSALVRMNASSKSTCSQVKLGHCPMDRNQ